MKICGIYKITSPSKKVYIGQSVDIVQRIRHYKNLYCKGQTRLYRSLKKYGWDKHKFEILCQCSETELNNLEKYYVDLFNTFNSEFGLNIRDGGGSKGKMSEETKVKIGLANKGRIFSEEHKEKCRQRQKGKIHSKETKLKLSILNKGKTHSEESKKKIRDKRKLQIFSEEDKQKMSIAQKNKKNATEQIKKLSDINKGNKYLLGFKFSEESKKKMSDSAKGRKAWNKGLKGVIKMSDEAKRKIGEFNKGKKLSKESIEKRTFTRKLNNNGNYHGNKYN